jgi:hypothetical protein
MKPSLISLMHYDNGWEQLDTTLTDEDSEYYSFEAETPSFSPFAIVAREPGSVPDDTEGTDVSPGDDTETPTDTPSGRSTAQTLGIIVLILIVIGVIAYVIYQRKENEK